MYCIDTLEIHGGLIKVIFCANFIILYRAEFYSCITSLALV